jgi:hypothetical protein
MTQVGVQSTRNAYFAAGPESMIALAGTSLARGSSDRTKCPRIAIWHSQSGYTLGAPWSRGPERQCDSSPTGESLCKPLARPWIIDAGVPTSHPGAGEPVRPSEQAATSVVDAPSCRAAVAPIGRASDAAVRCAASDPCFNGPIVSGRAMRATGFGIAASSISGAATHPPNENSNGATTTTAHAARADLIASGMEWRPSGTGAKAALMLPVAESSSDARPPPVFDPG